MRTALSLKKDFVVSDNLRRRYPEAEKTMIGLMKQRASLWERMGAGEFEDLMQEARCALLGVIESYDGKRSFATYLRGSMENTFSNMVRAKLSSNRCAWVESRDAETGEKKKIPCPTISMSSGGSGVITMAAGAGVRTFASSAMKTFLGVREGYEIIDTSLTPEEVAVEKESAEQVDNILSIVRAALNEFQVQVFDCIVDPPAELCAAARNLSGVERINSKHIALYLGTTQERVSWASKRIHAIASTIGKDLGVRDALDE